MKLTNNKEMYHNWLSKILVLTRWCAVIGIEVFIVYIAMYLLGFPFVVEIFVVFSAWLFIVLILFLFISHESERIKSIKIVAKLLILCLIFFIYLFITMRYYPLLGSDFAKGITKEKILSLKHGIGKDDIINIIGNPIKIVEIKNDNEYRLVYATPGIYGMGFEFDIWLIDDKIDCLYIEKDDYGVYHCDKYKCPKIFNHKALEELISYSSK